MNRLAKSYKEHTAQYPDYWLLLITVALTLTGLIMVYSASVVYAVTDDKPENYYFVRELIFALVGLLALLGATRFDYRQLSGVSKQGWLLGSVLLVLVLIPHIGFRVFGAQRWLRLGPLGTFQPSELMKILLAIFLASIMSRRPDSVASIRGALLRFVIPTAIPALLIMKEPDLGTTLIVGMIGLSVYLVAGACLWYLPLVVAGLGAAVVGFVKSAQYRMDRVQVFQQMFESPWNKHTADGYHVQQAILALGSGGTFGLGLGSSRQKFSYLPAPHTDSIFAIIGEELGLVGASIVVLLFVLFAWRGLRIAQQCPDRFGALLATGLTVGIVSQAFLNMGVVTDSIPFTGVPLPFISFGGSSLVVSLMAVGLLLSISRNAAPYEQPARTPAVLSRPRRSNKRPSRWTPQPTPQRRAATLSTRPSRPVASGTQRRTIPVQGYAFAPLQREH